MHKNTQIHLDSHKAWLNSPQLVVFCFFFPKNMVSFQAHYKLSFFTLYSWTRSLTGSTLQFTSWWDITKNFSVNQKCHNYEGRKPQSTIVLCKQAVAHLPPCFHSPETLLRQLLLSSTSQNHQSQRSFIFPDNMHPYKSLAPFESRFEKTPILIKRYLSIWGFSSNIFRPDQVFVYQPVIMYIVRKLLQFIILSWSYTS